MKFIKKTMLGIVLYFSCSLVIQAGEQMVTSAGAVLVKNKSLRLIAAVVTAVCTMKRAVKSYRSKSSFAAELHELVKSGTVDQVRESLERHPENVNHQDRWKRTPLFRAHNVEVARLLIDRGADVNHQDRRKQTPLFEAYNNVEVARLLIDHGADVNHENEEKEAPLFRACKNVEFAQLLIDNGANVNHEDSSKRTPLFGARNVEVARLLIDRGADVNHENEKKETPLLCAASKGYFYIVQLLIDRRANVNQADDYGDTPLFYAAKNLHLECVRLLLESGANIPFTGDQSKAVRRMDVQGIIQLLEAKNILTASSEVGANS